MLTTRRELLAGAGALTIAGAAPVSAASGQAAATALLDSVADAMLADYPEFAATLGIDTGRRQALKSRFEDRGPAAEAAQARRAGERLAQLKAFDRTGLPADTRLDLDTAEAAHALAVEGYRAMPVGDVAVLSPQNYRNTPYLVNQLGGAYVDLPDLLENHHPIVTAADADAYLSRLETYARAVDGETARIGPDAARGAIPPGFLLDITVGQIEGIATTPPAQWTMLSSFADKCRAAALPAHYATDAARIGTERIAPALARQAAALRALRPRASDTPGLWARPGGDGWYRWLVKAGTTTERTPDELHQLGLDQSRALQAQMDALLRAQGLAQGSVGDRLTALSRRPDLLFSDDDAGRAKLLAYLNGRIADIRPRLPRAFGTLVRGNLIIRRVPPAIQNGAPNGYAGPGSIDGTQPGIYYINLKSTATWPRYSLPTLCYHEGIPGHVWQGEYAYKHPLIRSMLSFNAYTEGWALYAEQLAGELGVYDGDPLGQLGFLQSMNFRACRLVVDTGLHAKRWSFDQALTFFQGATGMPRGQLVSELQRYCAMPGQACGYKMGHNEINRLRDKARAALGPRYDLRAFDDAVVETGSVPLTLLERVVDRHIADRRG